MLQLWLKAFFFVSFWLVVNLTQASFKKTHFWQVSTVARAVWGIWGSKGRSHCLCGCCCSRQLLHNSAEGDHLSAAENAEQHERQQSFKVLFTNKKFSQRHINDGAFPLQLLATLSQAMPHWLAVLDWTTSRARWCIVSRSQPMTLFVLRVSSCTGCARGHWDKSPSRVSVCTHRYLLYLTISSCSYSVTININPTFLDVVDKSLRCKVVAYLYCEHSLIWLLVISQ